MRCSSRFEREARARGFRTVAGVDEAGRGSLFGAVFAAAVVLDPARPIRGLDDSKVLEPQRRESLAAMIRERALGWAVAASDAAEIDRVNIYQASRIAMRRAVLALPVRPDFLLVDALRIDLAIEQRGLIHGDARSRSIAAASILAKVERDLCINRWHEVYPEYGLKNHKGYSTPEHLEALRRYGPAPGHRLSYQPVAEVSLFAQYALAPAQARLFELTEPAA